MLARDILIKAFDYNYWANGRILDKAKLVTDEQWAAQVGPESRSLHTILAHMIGVERVWRLLSALGKIEDGVIPGPDQLSTAAAMRDFSASEAEYMGILLQDWSDQAFADEVMVTRRDGTTFPMVRWHMLQHVLLHSMQHRSEAAVLLTEYGHSPGDIDYLFFL